MESFKNYPELRSIWRHRENGREYRVLMLTNIGATNPEYQETVVYEECGSGKAWSRPFDGWHERMIEIELAKTF